MSLRDLILKAPDISRLTVEVPEWGVTVEVRSPTGAVRAALLSRSVDEKGESRLDDWSLLFPYAIVACVYDPETGEPVFTWDDVAALQDTKNATVLQSLGMRCLEAAGMTPDSVEGAKKRAAD